MTLDYYRSPNVCKSCRGEYYGLWRGHAVSDEHFWNRVARGDGCWEWRGSVNAFGYGVYGHSQAHRESWRRTHGPIPDGLWVLHRCDNPPCVRPDHLWLGTVYDNNADRVAKGRSVKPSTHCKKGHPYGPVRKDGSNRCLVCSGRAAA